MIGTNTLFTLGDSEWSDILECYMTAFRAERFGEPWNGWATPLVARRIAEAFVAHQSFLVAAYPDEYAEADRFSWESDALVVTTPDGGESPVTRIQPDAAGLYDFGVLGYTFTRVDADDRVLREVC